MAEEDGVLVVPVVVRMYRGANGIWRGETLHDGGELKSFTLRTRDESTARRKWADYCWFNAQLRGETPPKEIGDA